MSEMENRRRKAARGFLGRVCLLIGLMGLVAYGAWFAPWAKPQSKIPVISVSTER
jgi:cell division septal protein FtsQ